MSRVTDLLEEIRHEHQAEMHRLQLVISILAFVPGYVDRVAFSEAGYEIMLKRKECLRLAKLYANEEDFNGISIESVIARLSEGLDRPGIPGAAEDPDYLQARLDEAIEHDDEVGIRRFAERLHATIGPVDQP